MKYMKMLLTMILAMSVAAIALAAPTPLPQFVLKNNFGEQTTNSVKVTSETIVAAGALSTTKMLSMVSNPNSTYAVTLAAPVASQDYQIKIIEAGATMTHTVTLALTNVKMGGGWTPTGTTTLTFTNAGDSAVFMAIGGKWVYLGGSAVAS